MQDSMFRNAGTSRAEKLRHQEVIIIESNVREPHTYRVALEQSDVVVHVIDDPLT